MTRSAAYTTYKAAIRRALRQDGPPDMDAVARHAVELLDDDLVVEAAITHLRQMARREWNAMASTDGPGPSVEVVNVRGNDVLLGDTDQDDREWLAAHRSALADGLAARAAFFRSAAACSGGPVTVKEVLRAEKEAASAVSLADALAALIDESDGPSPLQRQHDQRLAELREQEWAARHEAWTMVGYALTLVEAPLHTMRRTRRAVRDIAGRLGVEMAVHEAEGGDHGEG